MSLSKLDASRIQDWLDQGDNRSQFVPISTNISQANDAIASALSSYIKKFKEVVEPYKQPAVLRIACHYRRADIAIRSGWLPHNTTPWDSIGVDMTPEQCSSILDEFYRLSWPKTKAFFVRSISKKNLDTEAKEVFHDALLAHEHSLYRAVPRLLFPEIERITRVHRFPDTKKTDIIKILSKHLEKMTVSELQEHGGYDVHGLNMLAMCELIYAIVSALNSRDQNA
jgi:hypothetical protein